jgi:23S rRNA (cytosine1962-C5)-methyltransferase
MQGMAQPDLAEVLDPAIEARSCLLDADHASAFRLFNGHLEGAPDWVLDVYGRTLVLHHHATPLEAGDTAFEAVRAQVAGRLPWIDAFIVKERKGETEDARRGRIRWAREDAKIDTRIVEHGVRYAVDLLMNQDAGFYLDTRNLRAWLLENSAGKAILNTFAYTGSLGVAARAGGASRVLHTDLNRRFLSVAKTSYALNGFPVDKRDFQVGDFFPVVSGLKRRGERFDCVILDPPFFSSTRHGTVDLERESARLINKVRPLVRDGGRIAAINNALYTSGAAFMRSLEALCAGGWVEVEALIDVPEDVTGYPHTRRMKPVTDPAPFNHATKIVILGIRHRS